MNDFPSLTLNGAVATITLHRPAEANRLTIEDLERLSALINEVNALPDVLVLQLRATGKYFCSGFDIGSIAGSRKVEFSRVVDALEMARPITICVLQGGVYGGATDLALACDFRVGASTIDMFMPAARLGLHFYRSGLERYVSRLGLDNAKLLFLTGRRIDAQTMRSIGYLTHLAEGAALDAEVATLTSQLSAMAPLPLLGMKLHLNRIARGTVDADTLDADVRRAYASDDLREGQAAWGERRQPRFKGR